MINVLFKFMLQTWSDFHGEIIFRIRICFPVCCRVGGGRRICSDILAAFFSDGIELPVQIEINSCIACCKDSKNKKNDDHN